MAELNVDLFIRKILMRITAHGDLETKGSDLTNVEVDNNFIILYETFKGIYTGLGVYDYIDAKTYPSDHIVIVDEVVYISLAENNQGNTPGVEGSEDFWGLAPVADVLRIMLGYIQLFTMSQFETMRNNNLLIEGKSYRVYQVPFEGATAEFIVYATSPGNISRRAKMYDSVKEYEINFDDADSDNWFAEREYNSELDIDLGQEAIYEAATKTLVIPEGYSHKEKINLYVSDYDDEVSYSEDQLARDPATGKVWKSKEDDNTGNPLEESASPNAWELADADEDNVGNVLIQKIEEMSDTHRTNFEVTGISAKFKATLISEAAADEIMLDMNTDVLLTGDGSLELDSINGKRRKTGGSLLN